MNEEKILFQKEEEYLTQLWYYTNEEMHLYSIFILFTFAIPQAKFQTRIASVLTSGVTF